MSPDPVPTYVLDPNRILNTAVHVATLFACTSHDLRDVYAGSFPFVYEGKKHSSCSIADTGNRIAGNKHIFCGVADASESSGFDYEDCDMGSCNGPVNVSGKLKTADARTGSADPIVPCWYDTLFRARVPQDDRNGASRTALLWLPAAS